MATDGPSFVCPAEDRVFRNTSAAVFQNTNAIISGHANTPRFGHTNNITALIDVAGDRANASDEELAQMRSYLVGLVSASIAIFVFFCFWMLTLLVLKCLGYRNVGFFSGSKIKIPSQPTRPMDPNEDGLAVTAAGRAGGEGGEDESVYGAEGGDSNYEQEIENWKVAVQVRERRQRNIRIMVLLCGLVIVVMCILFLVFGVRSLTYSFGSIRKGLRQAEDLALSATVVIDEYIVAQKETLAAAQTIDESDICAPVINVICQVLTEQFGQTFNDGQCLPTGEIQSFIQTAGGEVMQELDKTRSDATEVAKRLDSLDKTLGRFTWLFWVAAGVAIVLMLLTIFIMSGVILAWQNKLRGNCIQKCGSGIRAWLMVPLFIFLVVLSWVFSMAFVIGSAGAADMCYDSPNEKVLVVLDKLKADLNSILFQFIVYYISGCPYSSLTQAFFDQLGEAVGIVTKLRILAELLIDQTGEIRQQCGSDASAITQASDVLRSQLCTFETTVYNIADFLTCSNWNSLYATVMYDGFCYQATSGFSWIASTQFVIVLFSMIILTLRVGFFEMAEEGEQEGCCKRRQKQDSEIDPGAGNDLFLSAPEEDKATPPADQQTPEKATAGATNDNGGML